MSTIWVLIMLMGGSRGALATAEFTTKERCEAALAQFIEASGYSYPRGVCVPK